MVCLLIRIHDVHGSVVNTLVQLSGSHTSGLINCKCQDNSADGNYWLSRYCEGRIPTRRPGTDSGIDATRFY